MSGIRQILLLSLENYSSIKDMYEGFLSSLRSKAYVMECNSVETAKMALNSNFVSAVLVFEPTVLKPKNQALGNALSNFAKQGGTVVFACLCSSFATPSDIDAFFARCFQLPWTVGDYTGTTFTVNPEAALNIRAKIKQSYSMKAVYLRNVPNADLIYVTDADLIYALGTDSLRESLVFGPSKVDLVAQGPVVFTKYHKGKVGWVGDVNNEDATGPLVLAMLDL